MKKTIGFNKKDPICQKCSGYGNQLFMCHYCTDYDHFYNKKKEK